MKNKKGLGKIIVYIILILIILIVLGFLLVVLIISIKKPKMNNPNSETFSIPASEEVSSEIIVGKVYTAEDGVFFSHAPVGISVLYKETGIEDDRYEDSWVDLDNNEIFIVNTLEEADLIETEEYLGGQNLTDFLEMKEKYPLESYFYVLDYYWEGLGGGYYVADKIILNGSTIKFGYNDKSHGPTQKSQIIYPNGKDQPGIDFTMPTGDSFRQLNMAAVPRTIASGSGFAGDRINYIHANDYWNEYIQSFDKLLSKDDACICSCYGDYENMCLKSGLSYEPCIIDTKERVEYALDHYFIEEDVNQLFSDIVDEYPVTDYFYLVDIEHTQLEAIMLGIKAGKIVFINETRKYFEKGVYKEDFPQGEEYYLSLYFAAIPRNTVNPEKDLLKSKNVFAEE